MVLEFDMEGGGVVCEFGRGKVVMGTDCGFGRGAFSGKVEDLPGMEDPVD